MMEDNKKGNVCVCVYTHTYIHIHGWVTLLRVGNWHNIVNQLYFKKKRKNLCFFLFSFRACGIWKFPD